jgi:hypothetical protein
VESFEQELDTKIEFEGDFDGGKKLDVDNLELVM